FGITAAETGHLVFATLHTNNAPQTIERILDTMPPDARDLIREQLALNMQGIVCQRLCKRADGTGRIAAQEIMVASETIKQLISEGKTKAVHKAMMEGHYYGMCTFNQALYNHVQNGFITQAEALENSDTPEDLELMFRGVMKGTSSRESDEHADSSGGGIRPAAPAAGGGEQKKVNRGFDF
ncbi:MAG: Flp pilus assembly complex ATPase component TadA, partial [Planctomycetes bacterium]|nr:Flp pilus assembly complex ATPase component TadA [Planctomycetota bacterium]